MKLYLWSEPVFQLSITWNDKDPTHSELWFGAAITNLGEKQLFKFHLKLFPHPTHFPLSFS